MVVSSKLPQIKGSLVTLDRMTERKPMMLANVHEARFENINKDTLTMSKNKRVLANVAYMPHVAEEPSSKAL